MKIIPALKQFAHPHIIFRSFAHQTLVFIFAFAKKSIGTNNERNTVQGGASGGNV